MSITAMWLLLAVVIIVILFASVLYKRTFTSKELALTGVMAALSLVAYLFFRVPFYGGSSFHLGNTFTALTALLPVSYTHLSSSWPPGRICRFYNTDNTESSRPPDGEPPGGLLC